LIDIRGSFAVEKEEHEWRGQGSVERAGGKRRDE